MPPKKTTTAQDPRAPFVGLSDDDLCDRLHVTNERIRIVGREAGRRTREAAEATITQAQEQASKRFASLAPRALDAALNGAPGTQSARFLHEAAAIA